MNKRLAILIVIICGMALFNNAYAFDLDNTDKIDIHGFISQGYLVSDDNNFLTDTEGNGSFQYNEIGINFSSDVSDRLRMGVQFLARDLGKMGNKDLTVDWAIADYSFFDWLNLRVGKVKSSHGLYNTERDVDMLRTFVFLPQCVYTEGWRDSLNAMSGGGLYGYVPMGLLGNLTYTGNGGYAAHKIGGGESRLLEDQVPKELELKVEEMNTIRTWGGGLTLDTIFDVDGLKLSGVYWGHDFDTTCSMKDGTGSVLFDALGSTVDDDGDGNPDVMFNRSNEIFKLSVRTYTGSLEYAIGNFIFAAEYMQNNYHLRMPLSDHLLTATGQPYDDIDKEFDAVGYYGSLTYRVTDWFEFGGYYGEYYANKDDKHGTKAVAENIIKAGQEHAKWLKDSCIAVRFDITSNWILKLETHYMDGAALMYSSDGNLAADGVTTNYERYWMLYAAKASFSF